MSNRQHHLTRLRAGLARINDFGQRGARNRDPDFDAWRQDMIRSLDVVLPSENYGTRFANIQFRDDSGGYGEYIPDHQRHRADGLRHAELLLRSAIEEAEVGGELTPSPTEQPFVDQARISSLSSKATSPFDLLRLVRMCEELNICYRERCYLTVAMLTRAILDHVPPIFGRQSFAEVVSNYAGGRSFKASMQHLESSARNIADSHLHQHVRRKEVLPTKTQVSFQHDLDVLLGEIDRIL